MTFTKAQVQAIGRFMGKYKLTTINLDTKTHYGHKGGTGAKHYLRFTHNSVEHRINNQGKIEKLDWATL